MKFQDMPRISDELSLLDAVFEDFRDELERILDRRTLGPHVQALLDAVRNGPPNVGELFRYGMEQLPPDAQRPDDSLAAFFVVVSELGPCPAELRIFATKCMEYCESEALDGWSEPLPELQRSYRKLTQRFEQKDWP
jgi:hypothetical protein